MRAGKTMRRVKDIPAAGLQQAAQASIDEAVARLKAATDIATYARTEGAR